MEADHREVMFFKSYEDFCRFREKQPLYYRSYGACYLKDSGEVEYVTDDIAAVTRTSPAT